MGTQELDHPLHVLQASLKDIQVHPIDALDLQGDMPGENISGTAR